MKTFALLSAVATVASLSGTFVQAQTDAANLTCAEFLAMDSDGMMAAGAAMAMADDAMADDAMADDAMADDAMADDPMADDAMADDMSDAIVDACTAHPQATVADAMAM